MLWVARHYISIYADINDIESTSYSSSSIHESDVSMSGKSTCWWKSGHILFFFINQNITHFSLTNTTHIYEVTCGVAPLKKFAIDIFRVMSTTSLEGYTALPSFTKYVFHKATIMCWSHQRQTNYFRFKLHMSYTAETKPQANTWIPPRATLGKCCIW